MSGKWSPGRPCKNDFLFRTKTSRYVLLLQNVVNQNPLIGGVGILFRKFLFTFLLHRHFFIVHALVPLKPPFSTSRTTPPLPLPVYLVGFYHRAVSLYTQI